MVVLFLITLLMLMLIGIVRFFVISGRNEKAGKELVVKKSSILINLICLLIAEAVTYLVYTLSFLYNYEILKIVEEFLFLIPCGAGVVAFYAAKFLIRKITGLFGTPDSYYHLYDMCEKNHLKPLESEADFQKMKLIAKKCGLGRKDDMALKQIYSKGFSARAGEKQKDQEIQEKHQTDSKLAEEKKAKAELEKFDETINTRNFDGKKKRIAMIQQEIKDLAARKGELQKQKTAVLTGAQASKSDWAIHGGIASAIAGPAAGVMVAADKMQKNAAAQQEADTFNASTLDIRMKASKSLESKIEYLDSMIAREKEALDAAQIALTSELLKPDKAKELFTVVGLTKEFTETHSMMIHASMQMNKEQMIHKLPAVLDGSIRVSVRASGKEISDCRLVLPTFGLGQQETRLDGLCLGIPENLGNEDIGIDIIPDKVWLIEKYPA